MCTSGSQGIFLAPYSADRNPIEELFAELKVFIKKHWMLLGQIPMLSLRPSSNGVLTKQGEESERTNSLSQRWSDHLGV